MLIALKTCLNSSKILKPYIWNTSHDHNGLGSFYFCFKLHHDDLMKYLELQEASKVITFVGQKVEEEKLEEEIQVL